MFKEIKRQLLQEDQRLSSAEIRGRVYPEVLVTDMAPEGLQAAAGPDRIAYLVGTKPLQIEIPNVKGIYEVEPGDIIFEAKGAYEKAFRAAMKKYGIRTLSDLDTPAEKKGFYDFVDRVWHSKEEKDKGEKKGTHKDEGGWDDPPRLGGEPSLITPNEGSHKDEMVPIDPDSYDEDAMEEELPLYSDHARKHKEEDAIISKKKDNNEVSPPARRHQAKGIKKDIAKGEIPKTYVDKKTGKRKKTNPWAMAWAQYDKYGKPSSGPDKGSKTMKRIPKK